MHVTLEQNMMQSNKNKTIVGFGEMLLRLNPGNYQKIQQANSFQASFSGAEANVIMSLSTLGHQTKFVTKVPSSALGTRVVRELASYQVDTSQIVYGNERLGIYFLEPGYGPRTSEVIYDRSHSAIACAKREDFNFDDILQNVDVLHISGVTPALSESLNQICQALIVEAKKRNIFVFYDSNYRSKLWNHSQAKQFMEAILPDVDAILLGILDFQYILEKSIPQGTVTQQLETLYDQLFQEYPNLQYAGSTKRTTHSMSDNSLQSFVYDGKQLHVSKEQRFDILDRVGGGDAFAAGFIHGIICGFSSDDIAEFANSASVLKHSIHGDINLATEADIIQFNKNGTQTIKR